MKRGQPLQRRTPLKAKAPLRDSRSVNHEARVAPPKARKRLPQRSAARVIEDEAWRDVKLAVRARDGHECRAAALVPDVACGGRLHPHHVWPTGRGGPRLDPANVLTVCAVHHRWAHDGEPARARAVGLLRSGR